MEDDAEMDNGFYSDGEEEAARPQKKRKSLLVALRCVDIQQKPSCRPKSVVVLTCDGVSVTFHWSCNRFPVRRVSASKQKYHRAQSRWPARETLSQKVKECLKKKQQQQEDEEPEEEVEEEVVSKSLQKRDKNIKENKAMVSSHLKCMHECWFVTTVSFLYPDSPFLPSLSWPSCWLT